MKARLSNLNIDYETNKGTCTFIFDKKYLEQLDQFKDKDLDITIKEYKEPRSNNANAYMWAIIQEMADILKTSKEELYKKYIKEKGLFRIIKINNEAIETMRKIWQDKGLGWFSEIYHIGESDTEIIMYYGSSSYNTKQMSNFIDYIIQDAKELGIDTTTLEEQQRLLDN